MTLHLGDGEYDAEGYWISRFAACWHLLETVGRHHPVLLDELAGFPYSASKLLDDSRLAVVGADTRSEGFAFIVLTEYPDGEALSWLRDLARSI